jgi:1-deoxyxylulose-5-phosphate synthase
MEFRALPRTDLKVSRLSFGTMPFGSQADEAASLRMVDRCLDAGINFFDTANMYNLGKAETILGKALSGRRKNVILATKVRFKMGEGANESGLSRAAIHKAIDASLKRLGTDYVDLYYLHWPDYDVPIEETLAAMDELVKAGKVRYPAVSNYAAWQVCEILWVAEKNHLQPPQISQPMYNLLARGIEEEFLPFCKRFEIAVIPYNPLAGGLLTGKHSRAAGPIEGTRFDKNQLYLSRYWHADYFDAVEELQSIAAGATRRESQGLRRRRA